MKYRALAVAAAVAAATTAMAGRTAAQQGAAVHGRVEIGVPIKERRPAAGYPTRAVPAPALASTSEVRNVVVYLKDAPPRPTAAVHAEIRQRGEAFIPRVVAVPVGSQVDFPNDDPIYHNVFSLSRAKSFDLGRYPRGESRHVRFDKAGIVKVFCDIHSHMTATVIVFNHPWFAVPDENGRYALPVLPPGDREITAWHERLGDTTVRLKLEAGRTATADFVLPVPPE